jgi:hypothetical protein
MSADHSINRHRGEAGPWMCPAGEVGASYVYGSASRRMKKEGFKIVVMDPVQVECAEGTINAKHVLLTANAFITKLDYLKGRVFPLIGCGSLSRPLNEEEQAAMGGEATRGSPASGRCGGRCRTAFRPVTARTTPANSD